MKPIGNRDSGTHPLPRGGTDLMPLKLKVNPQYSGKNPNPHPYQTELTVDCPFILA